MFNPQDPEQLQQSFREFARRPENRPLLEAHQQQEVAQMLALQEANAAARLQADVAQLDPTDQRLLAPVLRSPALQQLLIAMNSDGDGANSAGGSPDERAQPDGVRGPSSQLQAWVANPRVLQLLREAARALAKGALTEERLCQLLRQQVQAEQGGRGNQAGNTHQPPVPAPQQVQLPSHLLVEALNEHLEERRLGNTAYTQHDWGRAQTHYERALAVVSFVVSSTATEQAEVDSNRASVLLNLAALHLHTHAYAAAVRCCDDALAILLQRTAGGAAHSGAGGSSSTSSSSPIDARVARAWLRRAKANLGLHEYQQALSDCQRAASADPWSEEVPALQARVAAARATAREEVDRQLAVRMLRATGNR